LFFSGISYPTNATFSEWIISPVFELTGNQRLNFQYKITNTSVNMPKIDVYVLDSSMNYSSMADTSNFVFLASFNTANSNIDEWKMAEVSLNSYVGNVRIALVIREASQSFYLDNFSITTQPTCPDVYDFAVREASQSVLITYNTGNITESGVLLAYSPITENTTFNPETATTITIAANEELPFLVEGLTTGTTYAFAVKQNCEGDWTNPITKTIPFAYTLPISMDFNTVATTPTMTFSGEVNTWVIGNAENNSLDTLLGNALYVSKDNGVTATYNKTSSAESFASFPISFTPEVEFELSFDWKCLGEGEYDNITVYLVPYGDTVSELYNIISYNGHSYLSGSADWNTYTKILSSEYFGVYNLVFKWKNDHMLGNQPGGVIDNIRLISHACVSDIDFNLSFLEAENNTSPSIIVNVTDELNTGLTYTIKYKSLFSTEYTEIVNLTSSNFPYTITEGIEHQMIYDFQIGIICSPAETLYTNLQTISTPCLTLESPWFEDFESNVLLSPSCWNKYSGAFMQNGTITTSQLSSTSEGWIIANDSIGAQRSDFLALNTSHNTMYYWAMSPIIDLSDETSVKQIAFDLGVKGENIFQQTTSDNKFAVIVSLDGGLTWDIANGLVFSDNDLDTNHNFSNLNNQITRYAYKLVDENNQALSGKVRFAFYGETTVYDGNYTIFVDNVSLEQWSECQVPYGILFSAITSNSAKVSYNTWGLASTWEYVIAPGVETSVIDTVTPILVSSSSPIELSGLLPTTDYVIGIRSVCGTTNSPWTIAFFTTKEAGASIPYLTSFDDLEDANTWHITNNLTNNIWSIGTATSSDAGSAAYISIDNGLTYSAQSSSNITYAYMWKDFSFGETDELFELSFDWKIRGREVDNEIQNGLAVYLTTYDTPPTDTFPLEEERIILLYASDNWQNERVFLDNIRGDKRLVFLTWGYTNSEDTIVPAAIDNVSLYTTVCTPPTSVPEVAEIIGNNAIIMWEDADTTHTQWNVYYKTLAANTYTSISVNAPSVELNNLLPTTTYSFYVTSDCGETESAHSKKITFRTECPLIQLPYEESFDEDVARNTCWSTAKGLLSENVTFVDNQQYWFQSTDSVADNVTSKMKINIYGTDVRQHWLITPQIDLGNGTETNILSLDVALKAFSSAENAPQPAPDDVFAIVVSIDGGLTWSNEYALIYTDQDEDAEHNFSDFTDTSFTRITYLLQDSYGNPLSGLVKIGFYGESTIYNGDNNLYIDNLYVGPIIEEILPCDAPTELTVTNITSSTAEISWVGSADNYEIKLNAGEIETLSSTNKILTDLTPLTQYMVEVRAVCENENSAWVAISFLTHSEQDNEVVEGQVSTLSATNVGNTSATLNGALVSAGNSENFTVGFALSTTADFTLEDNNVQNITATLNANTFSQAVTDLVEGQTYFYRAYITNEAGTAYGTVETFTLLGLTDALANQI
ncbi:MAG: fibronectin type III domain-containing protein, partial [Bacteroidales bacterium]|nr:fibronectin type III domain-containing protein [Bacteroidales bacterium]